MTANATKLEPPTKPAAICGECGANLTELFGWKPDRKFVHCKGSYPNTFCVKKPGVHHGRRLWTCPGCKQTLGCDLCTSDFPSSVICMKCQLCADGDSTSRDVKPVHVDFHKLPSFEAGIDRSMPKGD